MNYDCLIKPKEGNQFVNLFTTKFEVPVFLDLATLAFSK